LPPNITIHPPAADAPAALAAFTGTWYGKWHGERTNAYMADQVFIFEKINPSTVTVVSEGIGRFSAPNGNYGRKWSGRYELTAQLKQDDLVMTCPDENTLTYSLAKDGVMRVRSHSPGGAWIGEFKKSNNLTPRERDGPAVFCLPTGAVAQPEASRYAVLVHHRQHDERIGHGQQSPTPLDRDGAAASPA